VINLSVPFMERGSTDWISFWEKRIGPDFYIVHYNRHPGVADASYASNPRNMLRNLLRKRQWATSRKASRNANSILELAHAADPPGEPVISEAELEALAQAFTRTGFTPALNWYRNFARNWELIGRVPQRITQPTLMLYGRFDMVPPFARLGEFVPYLEVVTLDCGHWIQQELPEDTNRVILDWLRRHYPTRSPPHA
jgi:pimeloyl-ACP methyl ester carboxylesterase